MKTLLLKFSGMQSWGYRSSTFSLRDTGTEPSKSGVLGIIACAQGRHRDDSQRPKGLPPLAELASLPMAVRVDNPGVIKKDYHIAHNVLMSSRKDTGTVLSNRYYLMDAVFLVGLEGPEEILIPISQALDNPVWMIYLGRKSCVPAEPVNQGLRDLGLLDALQQEPLIWHGTGEKPTELAVKLVRESKDGALRMDVPVSFAERTFSARRVSSEMVIVKVK